MSKKKTVVDEMMAEVVKFREDRNWRQYHNPKDLALGMIIEASELAEHFQYWQGEELYQNIEKFKTEIGEELSDVLYWVLLTAHDMDIDLVAAFKDKMQKNAKKYPAQEQVGKGFDRNFAKDDELARRAAAAKKAKATQE